jgi:[methyl-Co(III) methanol-specific corrinoid protein]:coenzyme M methyltransferase
MKPRDIFLTKIRRGDAPRVGTGSATSIVTTDLMEKVGVYFPEAHLDAEKMARLAEAGYTELGYDNVMPLFGVWHEAAAMGCEMDWGHKSQMPDGKIICSSIDDEFHVPKDFLNHPACAVPLGALELLKKRVGNEVAVVGKVFGPWTLAYHIFGIEEFLMSTLLDPDAVKRVLRELIQVTIGFANAQIESGADALTLADHCTRDLCSPDAYKDFLSDIHHELHESIGCPLILHICGDTSDRIKYIRETGIECFHFDSKTGCARARELAGDTLGLMGGTSNLQIVIDGTPETITRDVEEKLSQGVDVIGPECAVPLNAPYKNLKMIAEVTKKLSGEKAVAGTQSSMR